MACDEFYKKDVSILSESELKAYIEKIKQKRMNLAGCPNLSAGECQLLLLIAISEKQSRSNARLSFAAIIVASVGLAISFLNFWI